MSFSSDRTLYRKQPGYFKKGLIQGSTTEEGTWMASRKFSKREKKLVNKLQMEGRLGKDTFLRVLPASVVACTRVCTMNHRARTGVYSEAWLSVSITPVWLSLRGPLSTQNCLNTHTQRQEAPHAKGKRTLYTRPWREHIMGFSGILGLLVQFNT